MLSARAVLGNGFEMNFEVHERLLPQDTLLIHGNIASNVWWNPLLEVLRTRAHDTNGTTLKGRVILAEWRGCGRSHSAESAPDVSLSTLTEDYLLLLRHLGVKKVNLVGHSTGGLIALNLLLQAPQTFARAFLVNTVPADGVHTPDERFEALTRMQNDDEFCRQVLCGIVKGVRPQTLQTLLNESRRVAAANWHGVPRMLGSVDIRSDLARIYHPVLVAHGTEDMLIPAAKAEALAKALPRGRFLPLPEHGHSPNVENPELIVDIMERFLFGTQRRHFSNLEEFLQT